MEAGPVIRKGEMKSQPWILAAKIRMSMSVWRPDFGRAQIGKAYGP